MSSVTFEPSVLNPNVAVTWQSVCDALQIPLQTQVLPSRTRCPLCGRNTLHLYYDNNLGGAWHHCEGCNHSGDMIELAAAVWQTDVDTALRKLAEQGCSVPPKCLEPSGLTSYLTRLSGRHRIAELWRNCQLYYPQCVTADIAAIRRLYRLNVDISRQRWQQGPGLFVGAISNKILNECYKGSQVAHDKYAWGDVLITPFYDLPNRIKTLAIIGRDGDREKDVLYRTAVQSGNPGEAGIGLLPAVAAAGNPTTVFAVDDWLLALHLQLRNYQTALKALPLVAWHHDKNKRTHCWDLLSEHKLVFWSPGGLNYKTIMQAHDCDGRISCFGPADTRPKQLTRNNFTGRWPLQDTLLKVEQAAVPWQVAVKTWLDNHATEGQAVQLFNDLETAGADVSDILRAVGGRRRKTLTDRLGRRVRRVQFEQYDITEQDDRWVASLRYRENGRDRKPFEICNATLRVLCTVKDTQTAGLYAYGVIRYKGSEIWFLDKLETLQNKPDVFIQTKLAEYNLGVLLTYSRAWRSRLFAIAHAFLEPAWRTDDLWKWVKKLQARQDTRSRQERRRAEQAKTYR